MQGLYAYYKSREANYNLAEEFINERFTPDLNSMEPADPSQLNEKKSASLKNFHIHLKNDHFESGQKKEDEPYQVAWEAYQYYKRQNSKDHRHFLDNMIRETESIYEKYIWLLALLQELADMEVIHPKLVDLPENGSGLSDNEVIKRIRNDDIIQKKIIDQPLSWDNNRDIIFSWYKNLLRKDADYNAYKTKSAHAFKEDKNICVHIFKDLLFKYEAFNVYMESVDIYWSENKHIVKSMLLKTLKNTDENDPSLNLSVLSNNWKEDREFFKKLFEITIENDKEFEKLIAEKSKNWDIDRIAIMDKIILKMAIGEMINFPSIPIKVTINEYIELSKNFSTPKSKKFVNGILDVLSEELQSRGVIKKSGRGLIDNK